MVKYFLSLLVIIFLLTAYGVSAESQTCPLILEGHAILKSQTPLRLPSDLPPNMRVSGKYKMVEGRPLADLPITGQVLVGISGMVKLPDRNFLAITDNGFGARRNSPDYLLGFHKLDIDWKRSQVRVMESFFLHDPDHVLPMDLHIINEATKKRYLTGGDLDPESIQVVGESIFIGDEFGPYLVRVNRKGKVTGFWEVKIGELLIRSPDHYSFQYPPTSRDYFPADIGRSRGFEGMALSDDKKYLYPMLEGPLWNARQGDFELWKGRKVLHIFQFDLEHEQFTNRTWKYLLDAPHATLGDPSLGDFTLIKDGLGFVVERDGKYGESKYACANGYPSPCIQKVPWHDGVYLIDMNHVDSNGFVQKIRYGDFLKIDDSHFIAKKGTQDGIFQFALDGPETVLVEQTDRIIVVNDTNFPDPRGRIPETLADHEFILLDAQGLIKGCSTSP